MTAFDDTLNALKGIDTQALRYEVETLRAIRDWAMARLPIGYQPGDQVVIVSDDPSSTKPGSGWYPFRDDLAPGRTGVAKEIRFNSAHGVWQVDVLIDCGGDGPGLFAMAIDWVAKCEGPAS